MANILGFIKKAYPFLATGLSLGGPAGNLAASMLGSVLKVDKPTVDNVTAALSTAAFTPEQVLAIKQTEEQFQAQMAQMGFTTIEDMASIDAADRANARAREIATGKSWFPEALAIVIVVLAFTGEALYFHYGSPPNTSPELIGRILGTCDAALMAVIFYFFGSSSGSAAKNNIIAASQAASQSK